MEIGRIEAQAAGYEIRVEGTLGAQWAPWFDGWTIRAGEREETVLTGPVRDQSALFGLLAKIRDLGMPLLLVRRVEAEFTGVPTRHPLLSSQPRT